MSPVERISPEQAFEECPEEAFEQVSTGEALQLRVYEDEKRSQQMRLAQVLTLDELEELQRRREMARDRVLILYCS